MTLGVLILSRPRLVPATRTTVPGQATICELCRWSQNDEAACDTCMGPDRAAKDVGPFIREYSPQQSCRRCMSD